MLKRNLMLLLIAAMLLPFSVHAGLLPKTEDLYGEFMPEASFATGVKAVKDTTEDGVRTLSYEDFTDEAYEKFSLYLGAWGCTAEEITKDDTNAEFSIAKGSLRITFCYDRAASTASLSYPAGTRPEVENNAAGEEKAVLPTIAEAFETKMPSFSATAHKYADSVSEEADGTKTVCFENVPETLIDSFDDYLEKYGCTLTEYAVNGSNLQVKLSFEGKDFEFSYNYETKQCVCIYPAGTREESEEDIVLPLHKKALRAAVMGAATMQGNAMQQAWTNPEQQQYAERVTAYDFGHPVAAAVCTLSSGQINSLCTAMQCEKDTLASALSAAINTQYSAEYTAFADTVGLKENLDWNIDTTNTYAVLLAYEKDLLLVFLTPEKMLYGTCFMSTASIAASFNTDYVRETLAGVGLSGVGLRVYSADDIEGLKTEASLSSSYYYMLRALTATEESTARLLPLLYDSGLFSKNSVTTESILFYLGKHSDTPEEGLAAAAYVRRNLVPVISEKDADYNWIQTNNSSLKELEAEALPTFAAEIDSDTAAQILSGMISALEPEDKVLIVYHNADQNTYSLQLYAMAGLAEERIPLTMEAADKIVLVSTNWEKYAVQNGITIYDAVSRITLHDAKTGACLSEIGTQTDRMTGFHLVFGNTYKESVHWFGINKKIYTTLFPED